MTNTVTAEAPAAGALAHAFIAFYRSEIRNEKHLRGALATDAGNIDLKPLAKGIILVGGSAWCKENANTLGAAFFNRTLDAAKAAADEMGLEKEARKGFMNPLRAKVQRAIVALSGLDAKLVKELAHVAPIKDTAGKNGAKNEPRPDASEADTDESAATVRHKIEVAAVALWLETFKRLSANGIKTAKDKRDYDLTVAGLEALAA